MAQARNWEGIRADYCSGELSVKELAAKWRVPSGTLRSRACREQWPTHARYKMAIGKAMEIASSVAMHGLNNSEVQGSNESLAMQGINPLDHMKRAGESGMQPPAAGSGSIATAKSFDALEYQKQMAEFACRSAAAGMGRIKPPTNWREMATADTIARRALGLDSKGGGAAAAMIRITPGPMGAIDVAAMAMGEEGYEYEGEDED
jgi:hypothetical protein